MKIIIPISEQEVPNDLLIKGIEAQTVKCDVFFVRNPVTYKAEGAEKAYIKGCFRERSLIIAGSRNLCLPKLCEDDISVMQDSSLIHVDSNNIQNMYDLLMSDEKIAAVALAKCVRKWFPLEFEHITHGCVMARRNVWQNIKFEVPEKENCTCLSFNRQVRKFGIYRYLDLNNTRILLKKSQKVCK